MLLLDNSLGSGLAPMRLQSEPVRVFSFSLDLPTERQAEIHALLSAGERGRAARFKFAEDRLKFTAARAGLRLLLGALHGSRADELLIDVDVFGKPFISGSSLQFNMSHAGEMAAVAVGYQRTVGIDIEPLRAIDDVVELAERFLAASEAKKMLGLNGNDRSLAFLECWTRKEAFVKAVGRGLSLPLSSFEVSVFPDPHVFLRSDIIDVNSWVMHALDIAPGYCAALVSERAQPISGPPFVLYPCVWSRA